MSFLGLLGAMISPNRGLQAIMVVVVVVVMVGVLVPVVDFREVIMTSPPELAHCAPTLPPKEALGTLCQSWTSM